MAQRLANDPDDWRAKRYFEKKQGAKVRRCTFCNLKGHNRATCEELKTKVANWKVKNSSFRRKLAAKLLEVGVGVGALIEHHGAGWRIDTVGNMVMVKGLNHETHVGTPHACLIVCGIQNPQQTNHVGLSTELINEIAADESGYYYGTPMKVLSPTKHCLLRTIPNHEEWLKGGDAKWIKKEIFGNSQSDNWYENKYNE